MITFDVCYAAIHATVWYPDSGDRIGDRAKVK